MNILFSSSYKWAGLRSSASKFCLSALALLSVSQLNAQQSYTFTTAGATGSVGPTLAQITTTYASTNLNGSVSIGAQPGIQTFTIPTSGAYSVRAFGGQGCGPFGGRGAEIYGEFQFTAGQVLKILVGQKSELSANAAANFQYGGGGGSFVTDMSNTPYVVAGGGGGSWATAYTNVTDASTTTAGNSGFNGPTNGVGGTNGSGGGAAANGDGGAGFLTDGLSSSTAASVAKAYVNGGVGGTYLTYGLGGFGGGGGTSSFNNVRCGGGGGYSGGGGAGSAVSGNPEGGGGGSYNNGTNQANIAGSNIGQGQVVLTKLCNVNITTVTNPICDGNSITLNTNATSPISWSNGGSSSSIVVSPSVTTTYTVSGTGTGTLVCIGNAVIIVSVMPLPVISGYANPQLICVGNSASVVPSGALTYTINGIGSGSTILVSPSSNTVYTVAGTDVHGCLNSGTVNVNVNTNSLSVSPNTVICQGNALNISASGAVTYTWNTGTPLSGLLVSPSTSTVYTVSGTDMYNCLLTNSVSVTVNASPPVTASSDKSSVCRGESVVLSASGANTYVWANPITGPATGATLPLKLNIDVPYIYTVTGTDNNGCSKTATVSIIVNSCTGLYEFHKGASSAVYPNPGSGIFTVQSVKGAGSVEIIDYTGRAIASYITNGEKSEINLTDYANGIYYVKIKSGDSSEVIKLIKK